MTQKNVEQKKKQRHKERLAAKKKKQQQVRITMVATLVVVVLALVAVALFYGNSGSNTDEQAEQSDGQAQQNDGQAPVDFPYNKQPVLGDKDAPVKIVEFGDYKCPTCRAFDSKTFPLIKTNFIDTGKASYYFMNFPVIEGSLDAALAAEAIYHQGNDMYWEFHEAIYDNQGKETEEWATPEFLVQLAKENVPKVDAQQLKKDIENQTYIEQIQNDRQKGNAAGVTATPTIFVNGKMIRTNSFAEIKEAVQSAMKENE